MKTVSEAFKRAQKSPSSVSIREVYYKRRFWNVVTQKYYHDADWTRILEDEVVSISQITSQLDSDRLNEYKTSNVTLTLHNVNGKWNATNQSGVFAQSKNVGHFSVTPYRGSIPYWMKFQIRSGWMLADGSTETVTIFTGLATTFQFKASSDSVTINIVSPDDILKNSDAETVILSGSKSFIGDGSTKAFTTTDTGIKKITKVIFYPSLAMKLEGTDFTVSQLNEATLGAIVTFASAPPNLQAVLVYYDHWYKNQTVEDLVSGLVTSAGITSTEIDNVIFPNGVQALLYNDTQDEWAAGTLTSFETTRSPGKLYFDAGDRSFKALEDDFSGTLSGWSLLNSGNGMSIVSGQLKSDPASGEGGIYKSSTNTVGAWAFDTERGTFGDPAFNVAFGFMLQNVTGDGTNVDMQGGYILWVSGSGLSTTQSNFTLVRQISRLNYVVLGEARIGGISAGMKQVTISRTHGGRIRVHFEGVTYIDVTDTTYTTSNYFAIANYVNTGPVYFDNLYFPTTAGTATFVSRTLDASSSVVGYGRLLAETTLGGATALLYTRTSTDAITWDSYSLATAGNGITSATKRYIQVKIELTVGNIQTTDPFYETLNVEYISALTTIALANYTGMTVYTAIENLARFANYDWGFDSEETFFFRAKSTSSDPVDTLDRTVNLIDVPVIQEGFDRFYTGVKVTYGDIVYETMDRVGDFNSPRTTYGLRVLELDGGTLLASGDANVAIGMAGLYYAWTSKLRRRVQLTATLIEWLELGDVVDVSWFDGDISPQWYHGDTSVNLGDTDVWHYGGALSSVGDFTGRIIACRHDHEGKTSQFDLEEVL